jgi:membrane protein involved in colicin uptake
MDAEAAAKRQKMLQDRQTYEVPGYSGRVTDPMVAQNEYDRLAREQKAAARGDKPRKTQMELDMEAQQQEHNRILQQRDQAQKSLPGVDEATQRAVRQRMSAYGETPEEAFQNGGFAAQQAYASSRMNDGPGPSARTPAGQSRWR